MNTNYYVDTTYGYNAADSVNGLIGGMLIFVAIVWLICLAASILMLVSMWKIFKKAGKPGWASLVPIYNIYTMCQIADKEWWYILLLCVPIANIYAMFVIYDGIAKKLGKSTGFTIGMMFLPMIFFPILAFSKDVVEEEIAPSDTYNEAPYITASVNEPVMPSENSQVVYTEPAQTIAEPVVAPTQNQQVTSFDVPNESETSIYNQTAYNSEPLYQAPVVNAESVLENNVVMKQETVATQNINEAVNEPLTQDTNESIVNEVSNNEIGYQAPVFDFNESVNEIPINTASLESDIETMPNVNDSIDEIMQDVSYSNVTPQNVMQDAQQNEDAPLNTEKHTSLWSNNNNNTQM